MIIVKICGGLGNQMFQYALYRKLIEQGKEACLDLTFYLQENGAIKRDYGLSIFKVQERLCADTQLQKYKNPFLRFLTDSIGIRHFIYQERSAGTFDSKVLTLDNTYLDGYWQTERYFADIRSVLLKEFTFPIGKDAMDLAMEDSLDQTNSVGIHIRRGDYLNNEDKYGNICTEEYYRQAMALMEKKVETPIFYVFSDDSVWAREFLSDRADVVFMDYNAEQADYYDMKLMSACKHNIIANSSFSWWAAWLNSNQNKIVMAPPKWKNTEAMPDILPEGWIRVSTDRIGESSC